MAKELQISLNFLHKLKSSPSAVRVIVEKKGK